MATNSHTLRKSLRICLALLLVALIGAVANVALGPPHYVTMLLGLVAGAIVAWKTG